MALPVQQLGSLRTCPVIIGLWQLAGGHGAINAATAASEIQRYLDNGFTTFDMADIYGPAEAIWGRAISTYKGSTPPVGLTKFVPSPGPMTRAAVEAAVAQSAAKMSTSCVDMVQLHWWQYDHPGYLDAGAALMDLKAAGKIREVALTNFDTEHMKRLVDSGVAVVSNQVSYSLVDRRPEVHMAPYCGSTGIKLLTYGTLLGGFLSERWLGKPEPTRSDLNTSSLRKYKQFIDSWGGWALFQDLLNEADAVARKHGASIANVAVRWALDNPAVGGVIVGARMGIAEHVQDNKRVFSLRLDADDHARLRAAADKGRMLPGDCGDEYR